MPETLLKPFHMPSGRNMYPILLGLQHGDYSIRIAQELPNSVGAAKQQIFLVELKQLQTWPERLSGKAQGPSPMQGWEVLNPLSARKPQDAALF